MNHYCSNCGNKLMGNEKFCTVCGSVVENNSNAGGVPVYRNGEVVGYNPSYPSTESTPVYRNGEVIGYNPSYSNKVDTTGDGYSIASFILSLLSLFFSFVFAIISLVFAHLAVKNGTTKKGFVIASRIISIIDIVATVLITGFLIVTFILLMINGPYY